MEVPVNTQMFAWIYKKSELWVIGTGGEKSTRKQLDLFVEYATEKYQIDVSNIDKTEGFSHNIPMDSTSRVWLGEGRILMAGDAAGLVDPYRGVGMDSAALSGRLAAKAIRIAEKKKIDALTTYQRLMQKPVRQTKKNQGRGIDRFTTNEELQKYLSRSLPKMGNVMMVQNFLNKFRSAEKQTLFPP